MAAGTYDLEVTAILALSDVTPLVGGNYHVATAEFQTAGRLKSVVLQPLHSSLNCSSGLDHWAPPSRLASIEIEVPSSAFGPLMKGGRSRPIGLCVAPNTEPIASGLTVTCNVANGYKSTGEGPAACGLTIWMTGLSGAGKTTISQELEQQLQRDLRVEILDADVVRTHICKGLGFTEEDRRENVWRLALAASMLAETGAVVLVSAISPYRTARGEARDRIGRFIEVYVNAPLSVCEERDVKGLYKKARNGEIHRFTGIDDPYEPPLDPEVECRTDVESISESVAKIMTAIARERELWTNPAGQGAKAHAD